MNPTSDVFMDNEKLFWQEGQLFWQVGKLFWYVGIIFACVKIFCVRAGGFGWVVGWGTIPSPPSERSERIPEKWVVKIFYPRLVTPRRST